MKTTKVEVVLSLHTLGVTELNLNMKMRITILMKLTSKNHPINSITFQVQKMISHVSKGHIALGKSNKIIFSTKSEARHGVASGRVNIILPHGPRPTAFMHGPSASKLKNSVAAEKN